MTLKEFFTIFRLRLVGAVVLAGVFFLGYVGLVGRGECVPSDKTMTVRGEFSAIDGIKKGSEVWLAGVNVGAVCDVAYQPDSRKILLVMEIRNDMNLADDSIFQILSYGISSDKVVSILAGGSFDNLVDGGFITYTNGSVAIEKLLLLVLERAESKVGLSQ